MVSFPEHTFLFFGSKEGNVTLNDASTLICLKLSDVEHTGKEHR